MMSRTDNFIDLARYYDPIMREIDYDRWLVVSTLVAELLDRRAFTHVDLACGTGTLLKRLVQLGWNSVGVDLSHSMLRQAHKGPYAAQVAAADLCDLPFSGPFNYVTCVFDSLNFLLDLDQLRRAMEQVSSFLAQDGIFYFDVITERMVTEHFADMKWSEDNGRFSTTWEGTFDRETSLAELRIRVNTGPVTVVRERVHTSGEIRESLKEAGMVLLGEVDAESWSEPTYKTTRLDVVAAANDSRALRRRFDKVGTRIRQALA